MREVYSIRVFHHRNWSEVSIDLKELAEALKPYLDQPKPSAGPSFSGRLKDGDEFPIGDIRRRLFVEGSDPWNAIVRDMTAKLEMKWGQRNKPAPSGKAEECAHMNESEWQRCPKPHQEPEGMAWRKAPEFGPETGALCDEIGHAIANWAVGGGAQGTVSGDWLAGKLRDLLRVDRRERK